MKPSVVITKSIDDSDSEDEKMRKSHSPPHGKSTPRSKSPSLSLDSRHKEVKGRTDSLPVETLTPYSHGCDHGARMRRKSGDDVLSACSSFHKNAIFDAFRPRSKSDSKGKKPNIVSVLKNSMMSSASPSSSRKNFYRKTPPLSPLTLPSPVYSDSGGSNSESVRENNSSDFLKRPKDPDNFNILRSSPVSKVMDMFRVRSSSLSGDSANRRVSNLFSSFHFIWGIV